MDRPLELETREQTEGDKAVTRETDERLQPVEGLRQPELGSLQIGREKRCRQYLEGKLPGLGDWREMEGEGEKGVKSNRLGSRGRCCHS